MFVDTSYWIALFQPSDGRHADARRLAVSVQNEPLVTSSAVAAETWTLLRRRAGHVLAWRWLDGVRADTQCHLEHVSDEIEDEAWAWLRIHDERPYSFVDATSFALMRKLRIRDALAFDGDFAAAGFTELRP